jgi:hypothetical protein
MYLGPIRILDFQKKMRFPGKFGYFFAEIKDI